MKPKLIDFAKSNYSPHFLIFIGKLIFGALSKVSCSLTSKWRKVGNLTSDMESRN